MSVNKVILMGHTGKAPDFREFDNGGCVATFSLATTKRGYTTKDGRQIPEPGRKYRRRPCRMHPPPTETTIYHFKPLTIWER